MKAVATSTASTAQFAITTFSTTSTTVSICDASEIHYGVIRWYEPVTGRWLSNDPIGVVGGLNQYRAFLNNPVSCLDPNGCDPKQLRGLALYDRADRMGPTWMGHAMQHSKMRDIRSPGGILDAVQEVYNEIGQLDYIILIDHGLPGGQMLGEEGVMPEDIKNIVRYLKPGGMVILEGCWVAQGSVGESYCKAMSAAEGCPVAASSEKREDLIRGDVQWVEPRQWYRFEVDGRKKDLGRHGQ